MRDINETNDASASNIEPEKAWSRKSESPHASANARKVTTPQGTALMKATLRDTAYPEKTNEVTNTAKSASVSWDYVTEHDMGEEEYDIIVTQASVSDDEQIVIGRAHLRDGFYDLDDSLPMDPVQVESSSTVQHPCQPPS